jgi:hypothetical protein
MNDSRQPYGKIVRLNWYARRKYMEKGFGTTQRVGTNCHSPYTENRWIRLRAATIYVTTKITRKKDAQGFTKNRTAAREGGTISGNARKALEAKTGTPVVSSVNFLNPPSKRLSNFTANTFIKTQDKELASEKKGKQVRRGKKKLEGED